MAVGAERFEKYRGYELRQMDWYFGAFKDGKLRFTHATVAGLRLMIAFRGASR